MVTYGILLIFLALYSFSKEIGKCCSFIKPLFKFVYQINYWMSIVLILFALIFTVDIIYKGLFSDSLNIVDVIIKLGTNVVLIAGVYFYGSRFRVLHLMKRKKEKTRQKLVQIYRKTLFLEKIVAVLMFCLGGYWIFI